MLFDLGAGIFSFFFLLAGAACESPKARVVLTNDDGWAEANIRAQYSTLTEGGYQVGGEIRGRRVFRLTQQ